jgi:hypothetical protein
MKKVFVSLLSSILVILFITSAGAKNIADYGEWVATFAPDDETAYIIESCQSADESITVPASLNGIPVIGVGDFAFMSNQTVRQITIPTSVTGIGAYAFQDCRNLYSVTCSAALREISAGAFSDTASLKQINPEDTSIERVSDYAFAHSGIEEITLPATCTSIGNSAFSDCTQLAQIIVPASVTEIADTAFIGCDRLVIAAPYGSYAIAYAIEHGIPYEYTDLSKVTYLRGDADDDGTITIMDATKIQRVLARFEDDTDGRIALRSTLGGEEFGIMDATRIQRKLAMYDDPYGIGEAVTVYILPDGSIAPDTIEMNH